MSSDLNSDLELIKQIALGNSKAFEKLMTLYQAHVYGLCRRMMGSDSTAEDMAQDTWVKVVKHAPQFKEEIPVKAWLLTVAKNHCLNELRKRSWETELSADGESSLADQDDNIELFLSKQSDLQRLKGCIDRLTDTQRIAVVLSIADEISHSEISIQMGLQVNAVKQLLFRARASLGDCLGSSK